MYVFITYTIKSYGNFFICIIICCVKPLVKNTLQKPKPEF